MAEVSYHVTLSPTARRDYLNQIVWRIENRSKRNARAFEAALLTFTDQLKHFPLLWPEINISGQQVRKGVIGKDTIVLYAVNQRLQRAQLLAIRGAAKDWTNQPLPTD